MPKIMRETFIPFAQNVNGASDICEFGTPATGSPIYTTVIATLQALTAWTTGWAAETVANNRPFLEDMNAVCYVFGYMIAYILQMGVAEWDSGTTYYTNSIVQYGGVLYQSLIDTNLNIAPAVGASWKLVQKGLGAWTTLSVGTIYQAATDGFGMITSSVSNGELASVSTGSSSPPNGPFAQVYSSASGQVVEGVAIIPIRKNDYYTFSNSGSLLSGPYFISNGN